MSSSSTETNDGDQGVVELIVCDASAPVADGGGTPSDEITPLLTQSEKPKINIFSVSYPRRQPRVSLNPLSICLSNSRLLFPKLKALSFICRINVLKCSNLTNLWLL